jgi:hypothetical protein
MSPGLLRVLVRRDLAGRHPGRVISLAALSVPHPQAFARAMITGSQAARSWHMAAWQLPWLPERALSRRDGLAFRDMLVRTGLDLASADRYAARARDPAALRSPLSWYRAMPFSVREPAGPSGYRPCSPGEPRPVRLPGRSRPVRPLRHRLYRLVQLDGATHWLPNRPPAR